MAQSGSPDTGAATETASDLTISRPLGNKNGATFTFSHRYMFSIYNYDTPLKINTWSTDGTGTKYFAERHQFKVLPLKSLMFWMARGEQALMLQFNKMKFLQCGFRMHDMSFRSQFVTGSTAVGFANSNMQLHGMIMKPNYEDMPPYEIFKDGAEPDGVNKQILGADVANVLYPAPVDVGISGMIAATTQFVPLPWQPWFWAGVLGNTDTTQAQPARPCLASETQHLIPIQLSTLIGKRVEEFGEQYDLAAHWHNRYIPIKPGWRGAANNFLADYRTAAPAGAGPMAYTIGGLVNATGYTTGVGVNDCSEDMHIVPPDRHFHSAYANANNNEFPTATSSQADGRSFGNNAKRLNNLFLGVEHLMNQDGSLVPAIWDFYIDTTITIECKKDHHVYLPGNTLVTLDKEDPDHSQGFNYMLPNPYQAVNNGDSEEAYTRLTGWYQYPTGTGDNSFGTRGGFGDSSTFHNKVGTLV